MLPLKSVGTVLALLTIAASASVRAEAPIPKAASPEEVGLSSPQLARIEAASQALIEAGTVPGVQMLVARKGKIAWQATLGYRDAAAKDPLPADAIYRIYSMTKPITSAVAMMLVEEGRLQVFDPVAKYLPEFAQMKVGTEKPSAEGRPTLELSAPARPMTIQDLLRHTSGLTYAEFGKGMVHDLYKEAGVGSYGQNNAQFAAAIAKMPLRFSPGTRWEYGRSTDVLGRVIEVIEGKPLGEVLAARVFRPLGMTDTEFHLPESKLKRAVSPKMAGYYDMGQKYAFEGGGEGLTSTMEDYLKFCVMLLRNGTGNGKRLLGSQTVAWMTADHLGAIPGFFPGQGFGLGFAVRTRAGETGIPGSVGEYGWAGYAGTLFWIDPSKDLIAIYMANIPGEGRGTPRNQFRSMLEAALID